MKMCSSVSGVEKDRIKATRKKEMFSHEWLSNKKMSFSENTGVWWLIYVESEGMYCLLCKKCGARNLQNKTEQFGTVGSARCKVDAITGHRDCAKHKGAIMADVMNKVLVFQKNIDESENVSHNVLWSAFYCQYWLAMHCIANSKLNSLIELLEHLGLDKMKYFQHHSAGSHQEILHVIGEVIQSQVTQRAQRAGCFSVLCDDSSDSANLEQMISFIQFVDVDTNMVQTKFLFIANILEKSDSPDAETICSVLLENLDRLHLPQQGLCGLVTDGASTMVGRKNGVAPRLKRIIPTLLSTLYMSQAIDNVHLWLTQLWKLFDYSSKKSALLLKVQTEMRHITLTSGAQSSVAKTLKRDCQTRWLSFDSAVKSAFEDILAILHTLKKLSDKDATSVGLLKKMNTAFLLCTVCSQVCASYSVGTICCLSERLLAL